jgi:monoamine oxidase
LAISRRKFLKSSAFAATGIGLLRSNLFAGHATIFVRSPRKKVVILGAGMAGLVAGYELFQLGHDVMILEARMRAGGRVYTLREPFSDGLFAEGGAARIPDNHDLTLRYIKLFDVPVEPMYPSRLAALRFDRGTRAEVGSEGYTEALGQNFGPELGGDPARWHKIKGGSDLLPRAFAQRLAEKIIYGSPAVKIEQDEKGARVVFLHAGTPRTVSADRILCTIPFSVLRNIELPSTLSERKKEIINNLR